MNTVTISDSNSTRLDSDSDDNDASLLGNSRKRKADAVVAPTALLAQPAPPSTVATVDMPPPSRVTPAVMLDNAINRVMSKKATECLRFVYHGTRRFS